METDLLRSERGSVAEAAVRRSGRVLDPDEVAGIVVEAIGDGRFLILPHPEVGGYLRRKASDPERWLRAMQAIATEAGGTG